MSPDNDARDSRDTAVFEGVTATFVIASVVFIVRLAARFCVLKTWYWDDISMIIAWVCNR